MFYFFLYETRHYGWMAEQTTQENAEERAADEDNHDIYACVSDGDWAGPRDFIEAKFDFGSSRIKPWHINRVNASFHHNAIQVSE